MTFLNLRSLQRLTALRIFSLRNWGSLALSTALICLCGTVLQNYGIQYIIWFPTRMNHFINTSIVGIAVLTLYITLLILTRVVTKEDLTAFPAPLRKLIGRVEAKLSKNEQ
jgi:stage V sporulation protein B